MAAWASWSEPISTKPNHVADRRVERRVALPPGDVVGQRPAALALRQGEERAVEPIEVGFQVRGHELGGGGHNDSIRADCLVRSLQGGRWPAPRGGTIPGAPGKCAPDF